MNSRFSIMASKSFKMQDEATETVQPITKKPKKSTTHSLVDRLPGIVKNRGSSFAKLNRAVIQALKELTDLIDDMKGNITPRHEMLLTLHKVVGHLSPMIDINNIDLNDLESEDEEEDVQVPREVQDWIQYTFMTHDNEGAANRKTSNTLVSSNVQDNIKTLRMRKSINCIHDIDEIPSKALDILINDKLWYMNMFELQSECEGHPLKVTLSFFLLKYNLYSTFRIPTRIFNAFMNHIEYGYERNNNPYHNILHGADVLHTLHSLLILNDMIMNLSTLELFTALFSAAIHDYDHQGVTNNFIVDNKYQLAMIYNDSSVQENHHVSAAFKLMRKPFLNIAVGMTSAQFNEFRSLSIKMVLATDMCQHFLQVKKFNASIQLKEQIKLVDYMCILLHTADLSNPAKEWMVHVRWVGYIFNEFFSQGDRERALGVPISPMCDRNAIAIYQSQIGFIDFIIQPTFDLFSNITEAMLSQYSSSNTGKTNVLKRIKSGKGISNLIMQFKYCNNRPWETCIMENRSNWRRRQDKDYNEMKVKLESEVSKPKIIFEIEKDI